MPQLPPPLLKLPAECDWAVRTLFQMQRSDAPRGDPQAIARYIDGAYADQVARFLTPMLPRRSGLCPRKLPRVVDIGAGLAMYHANLHRDFGGCLEHYLVDASKNEVSKRNRSGFWHADRLPFYNSME